MDRIATAHFGDLDCPPNSIFEFPLGIPGFEARSRFLFVDQPHTHPLAFIQSIDDPNLCFLALPVLVVDPDYRLEVGEEERALLGIPSRTPVRIGENIACLVLLTVSGGAEPTANLRAPLVVSLCNRAGIQLIHPESTYSFRHPIPESREATQCSC